MAQLPNLIIIGSPKCGTTSLYYYLGLHPEIFMSREKELNFFMEERNWRRGLDWYRAQFETSRKVSVWGEASPGYTHHPVFQGVPQRMHSLVPGARLIQIVRDPMKRHLSHYFHQLRLGNIWSSTCSITSRNRSWSSLNKSSSTTERKSCGAFFAFSMSINLSRVRSFRGCSTNRRP